MKEKMKRSLDSVKSKVNTKKDDVLDRLYGASNQLNVSTFNALPEKAVKAIHNMPQFNTPDGSSRLERWYQGISKDKKVSVGEDIYMRFRKMRRRMIGAKEGVHQSPVGPIAYWETSKRNKPTVIYFHGFADNKDNAYDLAQYLVKDYHVVVPDLPGFGDSFKDRSHHYGIDSMAPWMKDFANALGIDSFHLIGHSMGGGLAIDFAKSYPDMVESLTLICSAGVLGPSKSIYDEIMAGNILFQIETMDEFEEFLHTAFYKIPFVPPFVKDYYFHDFLDHYDWYGEIIRHTFEDIESREDPRFEKKFFNHELDKIKAPCHIIWGEKDAIFPVEIADIIHKGIPGSTMNIFHGVGHSPHYEKPKEVCLSLKGFLDLHS